MKTKILSLAMLTLCSITGIFAQDRTTVTATNSDISDNLDLRAVASIFGDSKDLADFERRLNDPNAQISNLDLNNDNRVDYLRVIETVEGNAHIIVIQSVLGLDTYQDIATVEVERDRYNKVQIQVVGDVYMYGSNYIYEPVYSYTPVIYTTFWVSNYRPYYSSWYWGYYPGFYIAWSPFPIYTYHSHINIYINHHHHYNYVNYRRCSVAYNNYYIGRRGGNAYEKQYPNHSFTQRNTGYSNRRELVDNRRTQTRNTSTIASAPRSSRESNEVKNASLPRSNGGTRGSESTRSVTFQNGREITSTSSPRNNGNTREISRNENAQAPSPRANGNTRNNESPRNFGNSGSSESPRGIQRSEPSRGSSQREFSQQRSGGAQRGSNEGNSRGGGNRRS